MDLFPIPTKPLVSSNTFAMLANMHEMIINYYHQTIMLSTLINFSDCNRKQRITKYIIFHVLMVGLSLSILFS